MNLFERLLVISFVIIIGGLSITIGQSKICSGDSFGDPIMEMPPSVERDYYKKKHTYDKCATIENVDILSPEYRLIGIYHETFSDAYMYDIEKNTCLKGITSSHYSYSSTNLYFVKSNIENQNFCNKQEIKDREKDNKDQIIKIGYISTDGGFTQSQTKHIKAKYRITKSGDTYKLKTVSIKTNVLTIKNIIIFIINILLLYITSYFTVKDQNKKKILINSILLPTIIFGTIFLTIQFIPQQLIYRLLLGIASLIIAFLLTKFLLKTKRKYALINGFICLISTLLLVRLIWG